MNMIIGSLVYVRGDRPQNDPDRRGKVWMNAVHVLVALNIPIPQFLLGSRISALVNIYIKRLSSFAKF